MVDRPIIFSAPMVRALLARRKTQTRRLVTSPLRRREAGDRLYVRESYGVRGIFSDVDRATGAKVTWPKARPSIHMPRWASCLTLLVDAVRIEPLTKITEPDAQAEGAEMAASCNVLLTYAVLWNSLHAADGEHWDDNPSVVALNSRVARGNIDRTIV